MVTKSQFLQMENVLFRLLTPAWNGLDKRDCSVVSIIISLMMVILLSSGSSFLITMEIFLWWFLLWTSLFFRYCFP